jgi:hypothetical protein
LNNLAKERERPFQELFYYYSIERFLYRLSQSSYADRFVLKGGLMFLGWGIPLRRSTRDIDMHGSIENSIEDLEEIFRTICEQDVEPDGMRFDPDSVHGEEIIPEAIFPGVRIHITGYLGRAYSKFHIDIGFANVIIPNEITVEYPSLLGMDRFPLRGYPYETAIAEKVQAMVDLGSINSRMKDFFDIWLLARSVDIQGSTLTRAVQATFQARNTSLPNVLPVALRPEFGQERQPEWKQFLNRVALNPKEYPEFIELITVIRDFIWPVLQAAERNSVFDRHWHAGDSWS